MFIGQNHHKIVFLARFVRRKQTIFSPGILKFFLLKLRRKMFQKGIFKIKASII